MRGLALDVDGTITLSRPGYLLDLELASMLREVEGAGVRVMLVSGNALPVVVGLARYLGLRGPHVAENGCLVFHGDTDEGAVLSVCSRSCRDAARALEEELADVLVPSWQNPYRTYDFAFRVRGADPRRVVELASAVLRRLGAPCKASFSGYALHVRPIEASKGRGLAKALELAGLRPGEVVAVGDSALDAEMAEAGVELMAVANAEPELLRAARRVLPGSSSDAVKALVREVLLSA